MIPTCLKVNYDKLIEWDGMGLSGVTFSAIFKITGEEQIKDKLKQLEELELIEIGDFNAEKTIRRLSVTVCKVTCEAAIGSKPQARFWRVALVEE